MIYIILLLKMEIKKIVNDCDNNNEFLYDNIIMLKYVPRHDVILRWEKNEISDNLFQTFYAI